MGDGWAAPTRAVIFPLDRKASYELEFTPNAYEKIIPLLAARFPLTVSCGWEGWGKTLVRLLREGQERREIRQDLDPHFFDASKQYGGKMSQADDIASVEKIRLLLQGRLPWEEVKRLLRLRPKDADRFWKYLEALQGLVSWEDRILLRISERLYVVLKPEGGRIVKCACGHEYGDYRENWKIHALIHVRRTQEEIDQVYRPAGVVGPRSGWGEIREYYCPGCGGQHAVEVVPPGYPPIFEILPDIDAFYRELGRPLDAPDAEGCRDLTCRRTEAWAQTKG